MKKIRNKNLKNIDKTKLSSTPLSRKEVEKAEKSKLREDKRFIKEKLKAEVLERKKLRLAKKEEKLRLANESREKLQEIKKCRFEEQKATLKPKDIKQPRVGLSPSIQRRLDGSICYYVRTRVNNDGIVTKGYIRHSNGDIRKFSSKEEAQDFIKSENAQQDAARSRIISKRIKNARYPSIKAKFEEFEAYYKGKAPNSYERAMPFFEHYYTKFFIVEKGLGNIFSWMEKPVLNEFRNWLRVAPPIKAKTKATISNSTQNHIMGILNLFLEYVDDGNGSFKHRLELYSGDQLNERGVEALISEEQNELILNRLRQWDKTETNRQFYLFLKLLWFSGMRYSEAIGLAMGDFVPNKLAKGHPLRNTVETLGLEHYGYITLTDQLHLGVRKNLKSKKFKKDSIRIIPIFDENFNKELFRYHVKLNEKYKSSIQNKKHLVFYELQSKSVCARLLKTICEETDVEPITFHDYRHSYTTRIVAQTMAPYFVQLLTGHTSKSFQRYNHLVEQMLRDSKQSDGELSYFTPNTSVEDDDFI